MKIPVKRGRIEVLIDYDNVSGIFRDLRLDGRPVKVDFVKLVDFLSQGGELIDVTLFTSGPPVGSEEQQAGHQFFKRLRHSGVNIVVVPSKVQLGTDSTPDRYRGYADTQLFARAIRDRDHYDTMILVTHDGDFADLFDLLRFDFGKRVEVAGSSVGMNPKLLNSVQDFHGINHPPVLSMVKMDDFPEPESDDDGMEVTATHDNGGISGVAVVSMS